MAGSNAARIRPVNHPVEARPSTATPQPASAVSMPGSQRPASTTAASRSAGRGWARRGSKVTVSRASTSAAVAGVVAASSSSTDAGQGGGVRVDGGGEVVAHRGAAGGGGVHGDRDVRDQGLVAQVGQQRPPPGDPGVDLARIGEIQADGGAAQDRGQGARAAVPQQGVAAAAAVVDVQRHDRGEQAGQVVPAGVVGEHPGRQLRPPGRPGPAESDPPGDHFGGADPADPHHHRHDHHRA